MTTNIASMEPGEFAGEFGGSIIKIGKRSGPTGQKNSFYQDVQIKDGDGDGDRVSVTLINRTEVSDLSLGKHLKVTAPSGKYAAVKCTMGDYGFKASVYKTCTVTIDGRELPSGDGQQGGQRGQSSRGQSSRGQSSSEYQQAPQRPTVDRSALEEHLRAVQDLAIDLKKRAEDRLGRPIDGQDISLISANQIVMSARDAGIVLTLSVDRGAPTGEKPEAPQDNGIKDAGGQVVDSDDIPF